jgi:hypothetical protein
VRKAEELESPCDFAYELRDWLTADFWFTDYLFNDR